MSIFSMGTELKRYGRDWFPRAAILAIVMVPLLYGALYPWAYWNPTENFNQVPVALVNDDVPVDNDGETIEAGQEVIDKLIENRSLDWHLVSQAEAADGVSHGRYYFSLTIPRDFSATVASIGGSDPKAGQILATYNDSNSFLASTFGHSAMLQVQQSISATLGEEAAAKVLSGLQTARDGFAEAADGARELADGSSDAREASDELADGSVEVSTGATELRDGAATLDKGLRELAAKAQQAAAGAKAVNANANRLTSGATQVASGSAVLAAGLNDLSAANGQLAAGLSDQLQPAAVQAGQGAQQLAGQLGGAAQSANQLTAGATQLQIALSTLALTPDLDPALAGMLGNLAQSSAQIAGGLSQLDAGLNAATSGANSLADANAQISTGVEKLAKGADVATAGAKSAATSAKKLAAGAQSLSSGATALAAGTKELASGSQKIATGSKSASQGASTLSQGANTLTAGAAKVADGSSELANGIGEIATNTVTLGDALKEGAEKIPDDSETLQTQRAQVLSAPVALENKYDQKASGFGEGFAPMFVSLALFLGGFMCWMLLKPLPPRALASSARGGRIVFSGFLPVALIGMAQSAVVLSVIHFALGLNAAYPVGIVAFTMLTSLTFLAVQQTILSIFGPATGKLVVLASLMLQLVTCGGTYPIQTEPQLLQSLSPYLPMTWSVNALRMLFTGGADERVLYAVIVLVAFLAGSLLISSLRATQMRTWNLTRLHPVLTVG